MDLPKIPEIPSHNQLEGFGRANNCQGASPSKTQTNEPSKKILKKVLPCLIRKVPPVVKALQEQKLKLSRQIEFLKQLSSPYPYF